MRTALAILVGALSFGVWMTLAMQQDIAQARQAEPTPSATVPAGVIAPTGEVRPIEVTDVDGITHPDCLLYVGDTSVVVCSDGWTEES